MWPLTVQSSREAKLTAGQSRGCGAPKLGARRSGKRWRQRTGSADARVRTHPPGDLLRSLACPRPHRGTGADVCPGEWRRPRAPAMNQLRGKCPGAEVTGRLRGRAEGPVLLQFPVSLSTFGTPGTHRNLPSGPKGDVSGNDRDPTTGTDPGTGRAAPVRREVGEARGGKAAP